jgi:hypothetical protein
MRRIEQSGAKILVMSDLATLTEAIPYQYQGDVYTQLLSIHDGHFKTETGLTSTTLEYGPKAPADRIGWIGAGTETFYAFFNRNHRLGTRFLLYYMDPSRHRHWTDTADLERIQRAQPNQAENRRVAKEAVFRFLDSARGELEGFAFVKMPAEADARVAGAVALVSRVMGSGSAQDRGTRRSLRIREMCRMFAFISGRLRVEAQDVDLGIKIAFSQLAPNVNRVLSYALDPSRRHMEWTGLRSQADLGLTKKTAEPILQMLSDLEVLKQIGSRGAIGYRYTMSVHSLKLAGKFDPEERMFTAPLLRQDDGQQQPAAGAEDEEW